MSMVYYYLCIFQEYTWIHACISRCYLWKHGRSTIWGPWNVYNCGGPLWKQCTKYKHKIRYRDCKGVWASEGLWCRSIIGFTVNCFYLERCRRNQYESLAPERWTGWLWDKGKRGCAFISVGFGTFVIYSRGRIFCKLISVSNQHSS